MSYLVIDFGTSSCRASFISDRGVVISRSRESVEVDVDGLSAEINCDYVWSVVVSVIKQELTKNPDEPIDAVGVSSMLGYVFLDSKNEPLRPAFIWMDNRAGEEVLEINNLISNWNLYSKTGRRLTPELLAPKILWLRKNEAENFRRTEKIIGLKDEIVRRISGRIGTDYAHLDYTSLCNIDTGKIDNEICTILDIRKDFFPSGESAEVIVGYVSEKCSRETGLSSGIPVVNGTSDGTAAMYGGGILRTGTAVLVSGTTDVLMIKSDEIVHDKSFTLSINTGMEDCPYLIGGAMGMSGGTIDRVFKLFNWNYKEILEKIGDVDPGSEGLLFLPGLSGERAPYWNENISGSISGLKIFHEPEHIVRSLIEGISFRILRLLMVLNTNNLDLGSLNIVGGGGQVRVFNQIRADITGLPVTVLRDSEATSLGTAVFCRKGIDKSITLSEVSEKWILPKEVFYPDMDVHSEYTKNFTIFEKYMKNLSS